ncbi:MAG: hypothetical protein NTY68_01630 [Candidatus Micrarchaeota archaeon]|nr:hypothetical protein [Candidatus Micrarchaeota archaeon]
MRIIAFTAIILFLLACGCIDNQEAQSSLSSDECINYSSYGSGLGFDTTRLAGFQDQALDCIKNNRSFDSGRMLATLDSFNLGFGTGIPQIDRFNPVLSNNLAIRSKAIRMLAMRRLNVSYVPDFGPLMEDIRTYGLESNGYMTWYEGSGYIVYTLNAIHELNSAFGNSSLLDFEAKSGKWLSDFSLPNGDLAPIADTAVGYKYSEPRIREGIFYNDHETAVFFGNGSGYLLVRHPVANANGSTAIRNNLHTSFDMGSIYLWYNGSWRIRPNGYPGYSIKVGEKLGTKYDWNIQSADKIGADFEQWDLNSGNVLGYFNSWRYLTVAEFPEDYITMAEYPNRYEILFKYRLNTGPNGDFENYSRNVTVFKNSKRIEVIDYCNCNSSSSYLLVSDDVSVSSNGTVSYSYGKWSPGLGKVESSKRLNVSGNGTIDYIIEWE